MLEEFDSKGRNCNDNNDCKEEPRAQRKKYQLIPCRKNKIEERNRFERERTLCSTFLIIPLSQIQKENQLI